MILMDILFALLVAILFSLLLVPIAGRKGPGPLSGVFFFFILLFLIAWAGGIWIRPVDATWTASWPAFFAVGLVAALLIAAVIPPHTDYPSDTKTSVEKQAEEDAEATVAAEAGIAVFGLFTWVLLFALIGILVAHYVAVT